VIFAQGRRRHTRDGCNRFRSGDGVHPGAAGTAAGGAGAVVVDAATAARPVSAAATLRARCP